MSPKVRLWIGSTLLIVIFINYTLIGVPLLSKSHSIQSNVKALIIKQAKSGSFFNNSDDEYLLAVFSKEKSAINSKITLLNAITVTLAFFAASWMIFGLIFKRK